MCLIDTPISLAAVTTPEAQWPATGNISLPCRSQVGCESSAALLRVALRLRALAEGVAPVWGSPFSRRKAETGQTAEEPALGAPLTCGMHPFHAYFTGQCKGAGKKTPPRRSVQVAWQGWRWQSGVSPDPACTAGGGAHLFLLSMNSCATSTGLPLKHRYPLLCSGPSVTVQPLLPGHLWYL